MTTALMDTMQNSATMLITGIDSGGPLVKFDRLNQAVAEVMDTPQMRASVQEKGCELALGTPEEFAAFNRREFEFWQKMVKQHGLQAKD